MRRETQDFKTTGENGLKIEERLRNTRTPECDKIEEGIVKLPQTPSSSIYLEEVLGYTLF